MEILLVNRSKTPPIPPIHPNIHLSILPSILSFTYLELHISFVCLSCHLSFYLAKFLFAYPSVRPSIYLSFYPSILLFIPLSFHLFILPSTHIPYHSFHLSISLSNYSFLPPIHITRRPPCSLHPCNTHPYAHPFCHPPTPLSLSTHAHRSPSSPFPSPGQRPRYLLAAC